MKTRSLFFGALLCTLAAALPSRAATFFVTSTRDSGAGSLRDALAQANANADFDTINFDFNPPSTRRTITLSSGLSITSGVSINGPGASLLSIDGNKAINAPVFSIGVNPSAGGPSVSLSDLTITGGTGVNASSSPSSSTGGGINNLGTILSLFNCIVSGNSARSGGGGIAVSGGETSLSGCIVSGNSAANGGGISSNGSSGGRLSVRQSLISGNSGGGIASGGTDNFQYCTVSGNTGGGGGISSGGAFSLSNCTVSGNTNSGGFGGGGFSLNGGTATVASCTFSGNTAPAMGGSTPPVGGIYINSSSTLSLSNTILSNTGGNLAKRDTSAGLTDLGFNLASDSANGLLTASTDKVSVDPQLGPLQYNGGSLPTQALGAGSPAIDAGNYSTSGAADERGVTRPFDDPNVANAQGGDGSDIGSFELAPDTAQSGGGPVFSVTVTVPTDHDDGTCGVQDCTLREAINATNQNAGDDIITFNSQVFAQLRPIALVQGTSLPTVRDDVTINGPTAGVVVQAKVGAPVLSTLANITLNLSRLSFSGGRTGISNNGTLVMTLGSLSSTITNLENSGTAVLMDSQLSQSRTGIDNIGSGQLTVQRCSFANNTTGISSAAGADTNVRDSSFFRSTTALSSNGTLSLGNSTLYGNTDGVRIQAGNAIIGQCTLVSNTGSAISATGAATLLVNRCTVSNNSTGLSTGGAQTELRNTLLVSNGTNLSGSATRAFNLINSSATRVGLETDGNGQALLKDNGGLTLTVALLPGANVIDKAAPDISRGFDQRGTGFARVVNGRADIGAFEFGNPAPSGTTIPTRKSSAPAS